MGSPFTYNLIDKKQFDLLAEDYTKRWDVFLCACDTEGEIIFLRGTCPKSSDKWAFARAHAINESLRWGDPTIYDQPEGFLLWAIPIMCNEKLIGGIVAVIEDSKVFDHESGKVKLNLPTACSDLRIIAERQNITNSTLLAGKRSEYYRQQKRAETIHEIKGVTGRNVIEFYLQQEPLLLSTIRQGNRTEAIAIVNTILTALYFQAGENITAIKSLLMELASTMCRTAIEAGGDPKELLGSNYAIFSQLAEFNEQEDLTHWIVEMINRFMDSIEQNAPAANRSMLADGIEFIYKNFADPITRDDAAAAAHMSGSHFSKTLKEEKGLTFTDLLNQVRVDHAARLLRTTDKSLIQISLEAGFSDQSYFTKVFRKHLKKTPKEYRQKKDRS